MRTIRAKQKQSDTLDTHNFANHAHFQKINNGEPQIKEISGQNQSMKELGNMYAYAN